MRRLRGYDWSYVFGLVGFLMAGAALLAWGAADETDTTRARLLLSFGAAIVGSTGSALIVTVLRRSFFSDVLEILRGHLGVGVSSRSEDLEPFRDKLFVYHVSAAEGQSHWRCLPMDFSGHVDTPRLVTLATDPGPTGGAGREHRYLCEMGLRGKRLIMIRRSMSGTEEPSVTVLPYASDLHREFLCGVAVKVDWDDNDLLVPTIVSVGRAIEGIRKAGEVPGQLQDRLWDIWEDSFGRRFQVTLERPHKDDEAARAGR